jgi:hypothetical protein
MIRRNEQYTSGSISLEKGSLVATLKLCIELGIIYACKSNILMIDGAYKGLDLTRYRLSNS